MAARLGTCLAQAQPVLGAGMGTTKENPSLVEIPHPELPWVSDPVALVFLWAGRALHAQRRFLMQPQEPWLEGSRGRRRSFFTVRVQLLKTNKRKRKPLPLLTAGAAGLCCCGSAGSHGHRECSRSIPTGTKSHLQAGAAVSPVTPSHCPVAVLTTCITGRHLNRAGFQPILALNME